MKKLLSLILVLCAACVLIPAAAENSLQGEWYLTEVIEDGNSSSPADLGLSLALDFKEDGTLDLSRTVGGKGAQSTGTWSQNITISIGDATLTASFTGEEIRMETLTGTYVFTRKAPAAAGGQGNAVDADSEDAFLGTWKISAVNVFGQKVPANLLATVGLDLDLELDIEKGKVNMSLVYQGEKKHSTLDSDFRDGKLYVSLDGVDIPLQLSDDGGMLLELPLDGTRLKVYLTRES